MRTHQMRESAQCTHAIQYTFKRPESVQRAFKPQWWLVQINRARIDEVFYCPLLTRNNDTSELTLKTGVEPAALTLHASQRGTNRSLKPTPSLVSLITLFLIVFSHFSLRFSHDPLSNHGGNRSRCSTSTIPIFKMARSHLDSVKRRFLLYVSLTVRKKASKGLTFASKIVEITAIVWRLYQNVPQ